MGRNFSKTNLTSEMIQHSSPVMLRLMYWQDKAVLPVVFVELKIWQYFDHNSLSAELTHFFITPSWQNKKYAPSRVLMFI